MDCSWNSSLRPTNFPMPLSANRLVLADTKRFVNDFINLVHGFSIKNRNSLFGVSASAIHSFVQRIPAMTFFR